MDENTSTDKDTDEPRNKNNTESAQIGISEQLAHDNDNIRALLNIEETDMDTEQPTMTEERALLEDQTTKTNENNQNTQTDSDSDTGLQNLTQHTPPRRFTPITQNSDTGLGLFITQLTPPRRNTPDIRDSDSDDTGLQNLTQLTPPRRFTPAITQNSDAGLGLFLTQLTPPRRIIPDIRDSDSDDTGLQNLTQLTPPRRPRLETVSTDKQTHTPEQPENSEYTQDKNTYTSTYDLLTKIPTNLHNTFQILNTLKEKRIKTSSTINNLTTHKTDGTLPKGLYKITDCHIILDDDLQQLWMQASREAANKQLDILIEQNKRKLTNTEHKIEHSTKRLKDNTTNQQQADQILQKTDEVSRRYSARWLLKHKNHKSGKTNKKRLTDNKQNKQKKQMETKRVQTPIQTDPKPHINTTQQPSTSYNITHNLHTQTSTQLTPTTPLARTRPTTDPRNNTHYNNPSIIDHIQRQIQNFLTPTHILNYVKQNQRTNNNHK